MGIFFSKPVVYDPTERICELSKMITTAHSYNNCISEMFEDGVFSMGRVEVWYIASCAVRDHLPIHQHPLLNHYFWKWMSVFMHHLPHDVERLQSMKDSWQKTGWVVKKKIHEQSDIWRNCSSYQGCWWCGYCGNDERLHHHLVVKMWYILGFPLWTTQGVYQECWRCWYAAGFSALHDEYIMGLSLRFAQWVLQGGWRRWCRGSLSGPRNEYFREVEVGDKVKGLSLRSAHWLLQRDSSQPSPFHNGAWTTTCACCGERSETADSFGYARRM